MPKSRFRRPSPALVVALIALFVSLGGTSYAAFTLPKNSVGTKQLKKNAVTSVKIRNKAVTAAKLNTKGLTVPNAQHAKTADSATDATQVGGASLDSLTTARGTTSACDPSTSAFVDCGTVDLTLPRSGRVLVLASAGYDGSNSNAYRGDCKLVVDGTTTVGPTIANGQAVALDGATAIVGGPGYNANGQVATALNAVTDALPAGTHTFSLQCNQAGGSIEFPETYVAAVMLGTA
jgi:hypothetical protein